MQSPELKIGLIGAGFIGRIHALAIRAANATFGDLPIRAATHILCDADADKAAVLAAQTGFAKSTSDWKEAVDASDAVVIAVPSRWHAEIARYAIATGKPLLCEKPVGLSSSQNQSLADAAAKRGLVNAVGFTYLRAPMVLLARRVLDSGIMGRPLHFCGRHYEDYLASADTPFSWRLDPRLAGRCGALGDLGCHILSIARYLCGPVVGLSGNSAIVYGERPVAPGADERRVVENEDYASAQLHFENGVFGTIETSRIAVGSKMDLSFHLVCESGAIRFEAERMNELGIHLQDHTEQEIPGFRRVLASPAHPHYAAFLPAPGHGIGFNDLKTIEFAAFLRGIAEGRSVYPDLGQAACIARLCEAILDSSANRDWIDSPEITPPIQ